MRRLIQRGCLAVALVFAVTAAAQDAAPQGGRGSRGGGQFAGMERVQGVVTAVAGDTVTMKAEDGTVYQVTTTANTRVMKGQGQGGGQPAQIKVVDLKVGDGVMAAGNMDAPNKTLHAAFVVATDAETLKKARENLGKTYITGKVTAIDTDNAKMTIMRPDEVSQTIGFDETTSFKRGGRVRLGTGGGAPAAAATGADSGESITLADIKVGDNVMGIGAVKAGVFVPKELNVSAARTGGRGPRRTGADGAGAKDEPAAPVKPQQ